MVVTSQVGCDEIAPIILGYGNGARFRTLRSTIVENPLQTCCDGRLSRRVTDTAGSTASQPYFLQNKVNFCKVQINISSLI